MTFTNSGHHHQMFSLSTIMKPTRWSLLKKQQLSWKISEMVYFSFWNWCSIPSGKVQFVCVCLEWDRRTKDSYLVWSGAVGIPPWPAHALIMAPRVASRNYFRELLGSGSARLRWKVGQMVLSFLVLPPSLLMRMRIGLLLEAIAVIV